MTSHSPKTEAQRLLALSDKVGRVAQSLAELALERDARERPNPGDSELSGEAVDWLIRARRERSRFVPGASFGEPVWDMMLHLLHADIVQQPATVSDACAATGLPEGVARRWLDSMVENGWVTLREASDSVQREVSLASDVSSGLRRYFREIVEGR